ncbi:MAG: formate dehydrogenase subunit delta [Methylophilaceae bacterium]
MWSPRPTRSAVFRSYPDAERAEKDITHHLNHFWGPRMRKQLVAHVTDKKGLGLYSIADGAIKKHIALSSSFLP